MATYSYPIIANCNFESRDDSEGKAIHAARKAVESRHCQDQDVIDALGTLEEVLTEHADDEHEPAIKACNAAEKAVAAAWAASQE